MGTRMRRLLAASLACLIAANSAGAVEITTAVSRPVYAARVMEVGQSLVDLLSYKTAGKAFVDKLIASAVSPAVASVEVVETANGGSYACQENSPLGVAETNYWMKYNGGSPLDGSLMTAALQEIRARRNQRKTVGSIAAATVVTLDAVFTGATASYNVSGTGVSGGPTIALTKFSATGTFSSNQTIADGTVLTFTGGALPTVTPPTDFAFDQGQQDVTAAAGQVSGVSAAQALINWTGCTNAIFTELQAALAAPIGIHATILGRWDSAGGSLAGGYEALRKAQIAWIAAPAGGVGTVYRTADDYDLALFGGPHPDTTSQPDYGRRFALSIARRHYGYTGLFLGPTIASCTNSGATVSVVVTPEGGDSVSKPGGSLGPWGFAFYDGTTRLAPTWLAWSGNTAQWSLPSTPGALHCSYVDDWGPAFDPARVIKGSTSGLPLQQGYF